MGQADVARHKAHPRLHGALALLALTALTALALRLAFRIDYDEDIDALRFRLGVERFDVLELRPHAPFYPVYIAAAKLVAGLGPSPHLALATVSAASGAALVTLTALLAFELLGRRAAAFAAVLSLASPFLWLTSEKLLSDMAGAAVFTLGMWLLARARRRPIEANGLRTMAMVILGIGLGIRLSYFPFAIMGAALVARAEGGGRAYAARARDLASGVTLWLVPLLIVARAKPLVAVSFLQGVGHFTRWGGSVMTVSSPSARLYGIVWGIWANVLGGAWLDAPAVRWVGAPALALLSLLLMARCARRGQNTVLPPEIGIAALAYFVWAALGQNIAYKPRHFLPLGPLLLVALAASAEALDTRLKRVGSAAVAILAAQWFADGAMLARAHQALSPAAALVRAVAAEASTDSRPIITWELAGLLREGAPARRVIPVASDAALLDAVAASGPGGALITSEALSPGAMKALAERGFALRLAFAAPRSRYVDSLWNELSLFSTSPKP